MDDAAAILNSNNRGEYSVRQAFQWYVESDKTRKMVDKWEPTGVFFEKYQLTWRDCFFMTAVTDKFRLLNVTSSPCGMKDFAVFLFDTSADNYPEPDFKEPTKFEDRKFAQAMATMREDGPGHCKFDTY